MINQLECYLVELLQGHITGCPVVKDFSNAPELPVITLDVGAGVYTDQVERLISGVETVVYHRQATININLWTNSEEQRQELTSEIMTAFYKESNHNYIYCSNYNDGACSTSDSGDCEALTVLNSATVKYKCPYPDKYNYTPLQEKWGIMWGSLNVEPPFELDEINEKPPLLRNVFKCEATYLEEVRVGGHVVDDLIFSVSYDDDN